MTEGPLRERRAFFVLHPRCRLSWTGLGSRPNHRGGDMTAASIAPVRAPARVSADTFFMWMSAACVAIAFGGFASEYWLPLVAAKVTVQPIYHVHGFVASAWTLFLLLQSSLIASGNTRRHRELGLAGISLATLLVVTGILLAITAMKNHAKINDGEQYL